MVVVVISYIVWNRDGAVVRALASYQSRPVSIPAAQLVSQTNPEGVEYFSFIIWLAPRAGKMNQIIRCDWLPELDEAILLAWDYPPCPARKIPLKPYNKSFIDQACSVKMA